MSPDKLKTIVDWYNFGLNVIPLEINSKVPARSWASWLRELAAANDAERADEFITKNWHNTDLNVGHIVDHSLFVLDVDTPESLTALKKIERKHGVTCNLIIKTKKGEHHYFQRDPHETYAKQQGFSSVKHPDAIDVKTGRSKSDGCSMVVLPPSPDKEVLVKKCEGVDELVRVDQEFVDAVFAHNHRPAPRKPEAKLKGVSSKNATSIASEVRAILKFVDPDTDYDTWLEVLMSIHDKFKGSDEGLEIAVEWSLQTNPNAALEVEDKWPSFTVGSGKGFGSVCNMAAENGANLSEIAGKFGSPFALDLLPIVDPNNPLAWASEYILSDEAVAQIADPPWIIKNLVVQGHLIVFAAKPNAGKTALMTDIAALMVKEDKEVLYFNADTSGSDMKAYHAHAKLHGYDVAFPSMATGGSMDKVVDNLRRMAATDADLTKHVFIFDTLKKMTDVIQKKQLRDLLDLLRRLTAMGATVICLGHCNKYRDAEGGLIFEGTGDLESDVDELIYLESGTDPATGKRVISTYLQKVRSAMEPLSFEMSRDRTCTQLPNYIDIKTHNVSDEKEKKLAENNQWLFAAVREALAGGSLSLTELKAALSGQGMGVGKIVRLLKECEGSLLTITKHPDRDNVSIYSLKKP